MIEGIQAEWKNTGKRTRRNWWAILSSGKMVLLLQVAQIRQGKAITDNALKSTQELIDTPHVFNNGRWKNIMQAIMPIQVRRVG